TDQLSADGAVLPPMLKTMIVGGESPSAQRVSRWFDLQGNTTTFFNAYGPTEATVAATMHPVTSSAWRQGASALPIPIGHPLANIQVYVLDEDLEPVPIGVAGEICIGGAGISRGYMYRPDLTAVHFVPDQHSGTSGARIYRTGDLARYREDGDLEFVGRIDQQVKVRGFRIEPGEIEACLAECPGVKAAAVTVREGEGGQKHLVAFIVRGTDELTQDSVRQHLKARLPEHMVPSAFVEVERLPLSPNGKVDRKKLSSLETEEMSSGREYIAPASPTEELLAGMWEGVLGIGGVGAKDNFFERGGHSLLATQLVSRIRDVFGVEYPLPDVFQEPLLEAQARTIERLRRDGTAGGECAIEAVARDGSLPLSYPQQRLWFLDQLSPGGNFYNIPAAFRLSGQLDVGVLERSFTEIIRRHEVLRTTFGNERGNPVQIIGPAKDVHLVVESVQGGEGAEVLRDLVRETAARPFDLERGPLFRVRLLKVNRDDHVVILVLHHIIADGWSMRVIAGEVGALYAAFSRGDSSPLEELKLQYVEFSSWQQRKLNGQNLEAQLDYWREQLRGIPPVLELPTDRSRPVVQTFEGDVCSLTLPPELSRSVTRVSRTEGVTVFMTLVAAFQVLLHRYSGQDTIVVGTPIAGRQHSEFEKLIGFFVNNLVLRTQFFEGDTFSDVLRKVRESALGAYAHQDLPFEKLVEEIHPIRDLSHSPIFQVMVVLQNIPTLAITLPDLSITAVEAETRISNYDISLVIQEGAEGIVAQMEYNTDLFDRSTIERMLKHFMGLLSALTSDPEQQIALAPMVDGDELHQIVHEWNRTESEYPHESTVPDVFTAVVRERRGATALSYSADPMQEPSLLTYDELDRRSNQLAQRLLGMGIRRGTPVGIFMDRSFDMIVGMFATMKAGAAFVPLDPGYPPERIAYMIDDAHIPVLLTRHQLLALLPQNSASVVCLDRDWQTIGLERAERPEVEITPEDLAYIIYTSGSTGKPKGAMLCHRGLCNLAAAQKRVFAIDASSKILQFSSLSFDASVWETVMVLLNGATLCLTSRDVVASGSDLVALLDNQNITTVTLPPSVLAVLPERPLLNLRTIITAGEKCSADLVGRWARGRDFFNAYGPTETTVCASVHHCDAESPKAPPIGRPIGNFTLYVLGPHMQPVPAGVPGELYIGGVGLSRGYIGKPDLTAE
ncbi:MAG: amino acid adenylation domain-containing protein, partial [Bacteroidota bacterium]